ncbi:hypothetical protein [Nitratireductor sp. GCM10026969]
MVELNRHLLADIGLTPKDGPANAGSPSGASDEP